MTKPMILLLEDEIDLLHIYETAIAMRWDRYDVRAVASVSEAEAAIEDHTAPLALAVVDHLVGVETSSRLVERLRAHRPEVPVILITGRASAPAEARAIAAGAQVLWKPLRLSRFLGVVGEALGLA